jgi:hypothetical protein
MCSENGIALQFCLPYKHVGLVERMNRTVQETLRNLVNPENSNWDLFLAETQFAINTSPAKAHGFTPQFAATGREPKMPIERLIFREAEQSDTVQPAIPMPSHNTAEQSDAIRPMDNTLTTTTTDGDRPVDHDTVDKLATERMLEAQRKMVTAYDEKHHAKH